MKSANNIDGLTNKENTHYKPIKIFPILHLLVRCVVDMIQSSWIGAKTC